MDVSRVVVARFDKDVGRCLDEALKLIHIDDLNAEDRTVVVKVGVFSRRTGQYTTVNVIDAVVGAFDRAPKIYLV